MTAIISVLSLKIWAVFPGGFEITRGVKLTIMHCGFESFCIHKPGVTVATRHNEMCILK